MTRNRTFYQMQTTKATTKMKPDKSANDDTPAALKAAAHNYDLLKDEWCQCRGDEDDPMPSDIAYYRSPIYGTHGWMCCKCLRIVQTG